MKDIIKVTHSSNEFKKGKAEREEDPEDSSTQDKDKATAVVDISADDLVNKDEFYRR